MMGSIFDSIKSSPSYYDVELIKETLLAEFVLSMNRKLKKYQRSVGKIDQIISDVGGLLAIILAVFFWFLISYNKYRYEIKVAEGAFNYDKDGKRIKESSFNFWTYIKYTVYLWIRRIFRCRLKWKNCTEIHHVREQVNKQMDVKNMFKRLQAIEIAINHKI